MPSQRPNAGPPPVRDSVPEGSRVSAAAQNYQTIVETLKKDRGAEARSIQAMFGGDKALMERFLAVCFSSLAGNNDLLETANPITVIQAIKDAASLGLEPTGLGGEGWIIRYGTQAQFQAGWRGYLKRIRNSGKVVDVDVQIVYMNDEFYTSLGTEPSIHHVPILVGEKDDEGTPTAERGDYRGCYAWALMPSGKYIIEWMTTADINFVRDNFSQAHRSTPGSSPWTKSWGEMARKTVVRRLAKRLPGEAVDQLLIVESKADVAEAAMAQQAQSSITVSKAQRLALAAVNGESGQPGNDAPDESQGGSETEAEPAKRVAAAGQDVCGLASPLSDDQSCVLVAGHPNNHRSGNRESWS